MKNTYDELTAKLRYAKEFTPHKVGYYQQQINDLVKPIEYYTYSTPTVWILWNGKVQPIAYKSAIEAKQVIDAMPVKFGTYAIRTPDGIITL